MASKFMNEVSICNFVVIYSKKKNVLLDDFTSTRMFKYPNSYELLELYEKASPFNAAKTRSN